MKRKWNYLVSRGALSLLVAGGSLMARTGISQARGSTTAAAPAVSTQTVLTFVREHFGVPDTTKLSLDSLHASSFAGFDQGTVLVDDGKAKKTQDVFVSKDGRYIIVGRLLSIGTDTRGDILKRVNETSKLPPGTQVTVGEIKKGPFPGFNQVEVLAQVQGQTKSEELYLTQKNRIMILGNVYPLGRDPMSIIDTRDQSSVGPANAPVTIVEYSDLECPGCARFHKFLENEFLPKYGEKVRIIFKEYPLPTHDWSHLAAIANQCAYRLSPASFLAYRSLVFENQGGITLANVRDSLLQYGEALGIDRLRLAGCMDAKSTLPRIQESLREVGELGVDRTPTSFVNGRMVVGVPPPDQFYAIVDEALRKAR